MTERRIFRKFYKSFSIILVLALSIMAGSASASPTSTVTGEVIEARATEFLKARIPWDPESTEMTLVYKGKDIVVPRGALEIIFDIPGRGERMGRIPVNVKISVDNVLQKKLRLTAHVTRYSPVVKTVRPVNRGTILTAEDVKIEVVPSNRVYRNAVTTLDEVIGSQAIRNIGLGRVVTVSSLGRPTLVKKGDQVTIIAESGSMKITAPGIVREKGYKDSLVQVLNIQTQKMVYGMVMDSRTVKVNF